MKSRDILDIAGHGIYACSGQMGPRVDRTPRLVIFELNLACARREKHSPRREKALECHMI